MIDLKEFCNYTYNIHYDCEKFGCNKDSVCSCGVVSDFIIHSIDINEKFLEKIYKKEFRTSKNAIKISEILYGGKDIDLYAISRILSKNEAFNIDLYKYSVDKGYYKEELHKIFLKKKVYKSIRKQIKRYKSIRNLKDKIVYLLYLEYGHIHPAITKESSFELITIDKDEIDKTEKLKENALSIYSDIKGVVRYLSNGYTIVDGYNRISLADATFKVFLIK